MFGFVAVDKPQGMTSTEVLRRLKRRWKLRKLGHTGTLDPVATGLLIVLVDDATKLTPIFTAHEKEYHATARLGAVSDTQDAEGHITPTPNFSPPSEQEVLKTLESFKGKILQTPPAYSAKKVKGVRAYELARNGKPVTLEPRQVEIRELRLRSYDGERIEFEVVCSAGTYVRTLCHDLGQRLGTGAYMESLRRTRSGSITITEAVSLEDLLQSEPNRVLQPITPQRLGTAWIELTGEEHRFAYQGRQLQIDTNRVQQLQDAQQLIAGFVNGKPVALFELRSRTEDSMVLQPARMILPP